MRLFLNEGVRDIGVHYDIMCHYDRKLWDRLPRIHAPIGPIARDDFENFIGAVPKFHLAGHVESCIARYSLNNIYGVGRLDGEGGERCWANLNSISGSTSEKGPGSRLDAINHVMHQWNWCKTTGMGRCPRGLLSTGTESCFIADFLLTKWTETTRIAQEQAEAWEDQNKSTDERLTRVWKTLSTEPIYEKGRWTSVFMMAETPSKSSLHLL